MYYVASVQKSKLHPNIPYNAILPPGLYVPDSLPTVPSVVPESGEVATEALDSVIQTTIIPKITRRLSRLLLDNVFELLGVQSRAS